MPTKLRNQQREARKRVVLDAVSGRSAITAREIAAACGWSVAATKSIITALVADRRLRAAGSMVINYRRVGSSKEVRLYSLPPSLDVGGLPAWLRGPMKTLEC